MNEKRTNDSMFSAEQLEVTRQGVKAGTVTCPALLIGALALIVLLGFAVYVLGENSRQAIDALEASRDGAEPADCATHTPR